jgi:TolB-like protein
MARIISVERKERNMKTPIAFIAVVLAAGSMVLGQATTMPAADVAPTKILIVPFTQIGNTSGHEWVGAALQESFMTEANGNVEVQPIGFDHPLPRGDKTQMNVAAVNAGASLVVSGAYQYSDGQLRVTGEITDVSNGRVLGTLKATGALTDLFKIEDALAMQLQAALPQPPSNAPVVANAGDQAAAPPAGPVYAQQAPAAQPQTTYVYQSPPVYSYPTYGYSYPAYGYGYPYYYYGGYPIIIGGWGGYYYRPFFGFRPGFGWRGGWGGRR